MSHVTTKQDDSTLLLIDWDDTLYPTATQFWDTEQNVNMVELNKLFCSVAKTLSKMISLFGSANMYIVTNSDISWISECSSKLASSLDNKQKSNILHLILLHNIQIISARNLYSSKFPKDYIKWKQLTFQQIICKHYTKYAANPTNKKRLAVVSIGDSVVEYMAAGNIINEINKDLLKKDKNEIILHRIKLITKPSIKQLIEEHKLLKRISELFKTEVESINIDYEKEMKNFHVQKI